MDERTWLERVVSRSSQLIALIGLAGLLILACLTVIEVLLRWFLNFPILGIADVSSLIIGVAIACCMPLVFAERRSISVKMLGNALGPRADCIFEAFGSLVAMVVFLLITWQLWIYTNKVAINGETTWVVSWPIAPWYGVVTILFGLCVPVQALTAFSQIKAIFKGFRGKQVERSEAN
jgi:TRAP-type C4-dicarboxylate transport system permease small subunit